MVAILFVLKLASDRAVLNGNDVFSILVVSTKKRYSSFLKKVFIFQKICFKVKVSKTFETFTDCHIKRCRSPKWRDILKIPSTVFKKNLCSFSWLQNRNSKKKRLRMLRQKPTQLLSEKLLKEATINFYCLFDESRFLDICTIMELKELRG